MLLEELYELLQDEVQLNLIGTISNEGIAIKWEYDSFNIDFDLDESELEHLQRIYSDDLENIKECLDDLDFYITEPTIEDTYISFYIEQ